MDPPDKTTIHGPADQNPGESHFQSQNEDARQKKQLQGQIWKPNLQGMQKCPRDPTTYPRRMPKHPHKRRIYCEKRRCIWHRKNRARKKQLRKLDALCKPYTITKCYSLFQRWDPCDQRRAHTELNGTSNQVTVYFQICYALDRPNSYLLESHAKYTVDVKYFKQFYNFTRGDTCKNVILTITLAL